MKGASNRYGNSRGSGGRGKRSEHISYQWAKFFNKKTLDKHFDELEPHTRLFIFE